MSEGKVYVGDTPLLQIKTGVDLSAAITTKLLRLLSPKGLKSEVTPVLVDPRTSQSTAVTGILWYQCGATDLSVSGIYKVQVRVVFADDKVFTGETAQFRVYDSWE